MMQVQTTETIKNARIASTRLGIEDHGILTAYIILDLEGGSGQGFGGYQFDFYPRSGRVHLPQGSHFIRRVLEVIGADYWEELPGKPCRIKRITRGDQINCLGNFIEDKWFNPVEEFKIYYPEDPEDGNHDR
jgi:hypothetical protein